MAVHMVGTEIDAIKNKLSSLTANLQRYDINKIRGGSSSSRNSRQQLIRRPTYSHLDDEDTIGVGESTKILVERLVEPDKRCSVVCIYGMGGLGKTTLARKVYHHVRVRRHFDHFAWSSISQYLDIRAVVQGILIKLTSSGEQRREIDNMSDDEVLERLYMRESKTCLSNWKGGQQDGGHHSVPGGFNCGSKHGFLSPTKVFNRGGELGASSEKSIAN